MGKDGGPGNGRNTALAFVVLVLVVIVGLTLGLPGFAQADPKPAAACVWSATAPGAGQREFQGLDLAIRALRSEGELPALVTRLKRLLSTPCFRDLDDGWSLPTFKSSLPFVRWWQGGGDAWTRSGLHSSSERDERTFHVPPDARNTLHLDGNERHPLAMLLCRAADRSCGRETASWLWRAENVLDHGQRFVPRAERSSEEHEKLCALPAGKTPADRYRAWRLCIENHRRLWYVMPPLGSFRTPAQGWLILKGRIGHHDYCDTLSAYDLQTGATFRTRRCGNIFGHKRADAGNTSGQAVFERGQVPIDQLREAALMILLGPEMQHDVARSVEWFQLPEGVRPVPLQRGARPARQRSPIHGSTADTALFWAWTDGKRQLASGSILAVPDLRRQDGYPSWLLEVAEAGFEARCPAAPLPDGVLGGKGSPDVSFLDASREELDEADVELGLALRAGATVPCESTEKR